MVKLKLRFQTCIKVNLLLIGENLSGNPAIMVTLKKTATVSDRLDRLAVVKLPIYRCLLSNYF